MKSAGTVPAGAVDVSALGRLTDGPFLTVYLPTESAVENAAQKSLTQWKNLRRELADEGAPESALALVDPEVADSHLRGETLAIITDASRVLVHDHLREPFVYGRGQWAGTADLLPLLKERQERVAHIVVWADHAHADITAWTDGGARIHDEAGNGLPQKKENPGGWSQSRYQRRVEGQWTENAQDAVRHITELAEDIGARIIVIGGEVGARSLIHNEMPTTWGDKTVVIESRDESEVRAAVNTVIASDTVALLEKFKEERGQNDRAADGIRATVDAINRAAVDVLLVRDDRDERRNLPHEEAAVIDSLVRDAIATGASVRVIPGSSTVTDGVGALLRWA